MHINSNDFDPENRNIVKFSKGIDGQFNLARTVTVAALVCGLVVALGSAWLYTRADSERENRVWVIDEGVALQAKASSGTAEKPLEVRDHVVRFHELILNIAPNIESINYNHSRAFNMCDESGRRYCADLSEKHFYEDVCRIDASQQFILDSVRVDCSRSPYRARVWGKLYFLRKSNITRYSFSSSCELVNVERSGNNPHGLYIRNFIADQTLLDSSKR